MDNGQFRNNPRATWLQSEQSGKPCPYFRTGLGTDMPTVVQNLSFLKELAWALTVARRTRSPLEPCPHRQQVSIISRQV